MATRRLNLLLAEDNFADVLLVREAIRIENLPLEVHLASDGEQAMDFVTRAEQDSAAPCPDVALLDLNLAKVNGFSILHRIRCSEKFKNIPVVIFTFSDAPGDRSQATGLGAGYFRKPPSYEEFVKIGAFLKRLLEESGIL